MSSGEVRAAVCEGRPGLSTRPRCQRRGGGGYYDGDPAGAIPFGNGTLTPYPTDPRAPVHPDAPYTRGPIDGTYHGKDSLSNVLIFPGYRSTFVVNQTVVAPFGSWYGCPGYIDARYVVATPWPYAVRSSMMATFFSLSASAA